MQTKLTLRLEDDLIAQAKEYADKNGKSVSQLVADYFRLLAAQEKKPAPTDIPLTQSLRGILRRTEADKEDYRNYLEEKHR